MRHNHLLIVARYLKKFKNYVWEKYHCMQDYFFQNFELSIGSEHIENAIYPSSNQSPVKIFRNFLERKSYRDYAFPKKYFALWKIEKYAKEPIQT